MAARKRNGLAETTRLRIQATKIVDRLQRFVLGEKDNRGFEINLTMKEIRGMEVLLRKVLPDLSTIDHTLEASRRVSEMSNEQLESIAKRGSTRTASQEEGERKPDPIH